MKKYISLIFITAMLCNLFSSVAYASPCCEIDINSVVESGDKVVFNLGYSTTLSPRDVKLTAYLDNSDNVFIRAAESTAVVTDSDGIVSMEFDSSVFLKGYKYEIVPKFTEYCKYYACYSGRMFYTANCGLEVIDYTPDTTISLEPGEAVAIRLRATENNFYNFSCDTEKGYVSVKNYKGGIIESVDYYEAGEEIICIVKETSGRNAEFVLDFSPVTSILLPSLIPGMPGVNDLLFRVGTENPIYSINIPVSGVYDFRLTDGYADGYFKLMKDGETVSWVNKDASYFLKSGTYQIVTADVYSDTTAEIYFMPPESVTLNREYCAADFGSESDFFLRLDAPTELTLSNDDGIGMYIDIQAEAHDIHASISDYPRVYPAGEYYLKIMVYDTESEGKFSIKGRALTSIKENTLCSPGFTDLYGNLHYAFQAPADGIYEFDFSQSSDIGDSKVFLFSDYEYCDYVYKELKADEWINIGVEQGTQLIVRRATEPEFSSLTLDTPSAYDYISGKKFYFSYTATEADSYKISVDYDCELKLYTEGRVIFDGMSDNVKLFELEENEILYIEIRGTSINMYPVTKDIKISKRLMKVENGETFKLEANTTTDVNFAVEEDGLYNINILKSGRSDSMRFNFNGEYGGYIGSYAANVTVAKYLYADDNNVVSFSEAGNSSCTAAITVQKLDCSIINLNETTDVTSEEYYMFAPSEQGVYNINALIGGEKNEYPIEDVISTKNAYPIMKVGSDWMIYAAPDAVFYINFSENLQATIKKVNETEAKEGVTYKTESEPVVFCFDAPADGYYKINSDLSNTELNIFFDNNWSRISGTYSCLFNLCAGKNYILSAPIIYDDAGTPNGSFCISEYNNMSEFSVSVEDCYFLPDGRVNMEFVVAAPENQDVTYGFEYTSGGVTKSVTCGYEVMYCSDKRYHRADIRDFELGKTYTVKPFVAPSDDNFDYNAPVEGKIYGEEKTFTVEMYDGIQTLTKKTTPVRFDLSGHNNGNGNDFYFKFTQPKTEMVYITLPEYLRYYDLYDENMSWVRSAGAGYNLEGGKTYYIMAYCGADGIFPVTVSSLPESDTSKEYAITNAVFDGNSLSFTFKGDAAEATTVYAALYNADGRLTEIKEIKQPQGDMAVSFENVTDSLYCKLMALESNGLVPLCDSLALSTK